MQSIIFDDGKKEYDINGDSSKIIRFNPSDMGIIKRYDEAMDKINSLADKYTELSFKIADPKKVSKEEIKTIKEQLDIMDGDIKGIIDHIFGSEISDTIFGSQSPWNTINGTFLFENVVNGLTSIMDSEIKKEIRASKKRIKKYVEMVK